jgi:hypothetical protein
MGGVVEGVVAAEVVVEVEVVVVLVVVEDGVVGRTPIATTMLRMKFFVFP